MDYQQNRIEVPTDGVTVEWPPLPEPPLAWGAPTDARHGAATRWAVRLRDAAAAARWVLLWYAASRVVVLVVAALEGYATHHSFMHELSNWDGVWYMQLAARGYPAQLSSVQTDLGFFPLYPLLIRGAANALALAGTPGELHWRIAVIGVGISQLGGLMAALLVYRLSAGWWGERAGRRAAAVFCVFPGSVVFSMVYAEGLMIPLVVGCIFALEARRWLIAGVLAGLATACEPEGVLLVAVCCVSAIRHLRRVGWNRDEAVRCLAAPLLSTTGAVAVASYLWAHAGTPFATLITQRDQWHERFDPLALVHQAQVLAQQLPHPVTGYSVLNPIGGLVGAAVLALSLALLIARRRTLSAEAWLWTAGISLMAVTAARMAPNSRMLITAFPAVAVLGASSSGRRFWALQALNVVLLIGCSWITFVGHRLPP